MDKYVLYSCAFMSSKFFTFSALFFSSVLLTTGCAKHDAETPQSSKQTQSSNQLRIAVVANGTTGSLDFIGAPEIIAKDPIFLEELKKRHIDLKWEPVTTAAVATLVNENFINNKIDFAFYGNLPSVFLNATSTKTQIIVPGGIGSNVYLVVPSQSKATNIKDLKGKKIALHRGRPWEVNFAQLLQEKSLKLSDFQIVNLNPQAGTAAIAANSVDAFFTLSDALILEDKKIGKIIWSSRNLPRNWKMRAELWGTKQYVNANPEVTQLLADATVRAYHWISEHQAEYQQSQTKFGQPLSVIQREQDNNSAWKYNWNPDYDINVLTTHYDRVIKHALDHQLIQSPIQSAELLDPKFTQQAIKNLNLENYWADQP